MALGLDRRRINVKGGGTLFIREIDPTPTAAFASVGFIKEDSFFDEHTMVESVDSAGRYIDTKSGSQHVRFETQLMQTSIDEINLLRNAFLGSDAGRYYEIYYQVPLNNGDKQEFLFPVARITPNVNLQFRAATERTVNVVIHALAPKVALTRTPTAFNTAQWQPYVVVQGATAAGPPTDAATVPQSAI